MHNIEKKVLEINLFSPMNVKRSRMLAAKFKKCSKKAQSQENGLHLTGKLQVNKMKF